MGDIIDVDFRKPDRDEPGRQELMAKWVSDTFKDDVGIDRPDIAQLVAELCEREIAALDEHLELSMQIPVTVASAREREVAELAVREALHQVQDHLTTVARQARQALTRVAHGAALITAGQLTSPPVR